MRGRGSLVGADEEARAVELERVKEALRFLPQGVPASLWNLNLEALAEAIVDGEKRTSPTGVPLVRIGDTWYYNDAGDMFTFLREYRD